MCTDRVFYKGETVNSGIFSRSPIMRRLLSLHQRFAKTRRMSPTAINKCALTTLLKAETFRYPEQMRAAAVDYWQFGKGRRQNGAPDSVPNWTFADTFTEWRRMKMILRAALAQSPKASWRLLSQIAETIDNPSLLAALARHECAHVRAAVADNVHTYLETLSALTSDTDADVRYAVAENHNIPLAILERLSEDENPYVASRAQRTMARLNSPEVHVGNFQKAVHKHRRNAFA
jgi:hypothetical protein